MSINQWALHAESPRTTIPHKFFPECQFSSTITQFITVALVSTPLIHPFHPGKGSVKNITSIRHLIIHTIIKILDHEGFMSHVPDHGPVFNLEPFTEHF